MSVRMLRKATLGLFVAIFTALAGDAHGSLMNSGDSISYGNCVGAGNGTSLCVLTWSNNNGYFVGTVYWNGIASCGGPSYWHANWDALCSSGWGYHTNQVYEAGTSSVAQMQSDGNFVLYDGNGVARWATNTDQYPGSYLNLQYDGNLVVYTSNNVPVWSIF